MSNLLKRGQVLRSRHSGQTGISESSIDCGGVSFLQEATTASGSPAVGQDLDHAHASGEIRH